MEDYRVIKQLGEGAWGMVHMAEQKSTGRIVAMKQVKQNVAAKSGSTHQGIDSGTIREIKLLQELKHENVIELLDVVVAPDQGLTLIYECAHTDLFKILMNLAIPISLADIKQHMRTLLVAIQACHERWILHRDLKPDNIFFLQDGTMKLGDFGLARNYGTPGRYLSPQPVTLNYKPPELLLGASDYSSSVDMWSVGCIFAELFLRRKPFLQPVVGPDMSQFQTDISQLEIIFKVVGTPNDTNWPNYKALPLASRGLEWNDTPGIPLEDLLPAAPQDALSLLKRLLVLDPNKRLSASEALSHPYFSNDPPPTPKQRLVISPPQPP